MHIDIGAYRAGRTRQVCQLKLELLFMFTTNRGEWVCTLNYEPGYLLRAYMWFTVRCYGPYIFYC